MYAHASRATSFSFKDSMRGATAACSLAKRTGEWIFADAKDQAKAPMNFEGRFNNSSWSSINARSSTALKNSQDPTFDQTTARQRRASSCAAKWSIIRSSSAPSMSETPLFPETPSSRRSSFEASSSIGLLKWFEASVAASFPAALRWAKPRVGCRHVFAMARYVSGATTRAAFISSAACASSFGQRASVCVSNSKATRAVNAAFVSGGTVAALYALKSLTKPGAVAPSRKVPPSRKNLSAATSKSGESRMFPSDNADTKEMSSELRKFSIFGKAL
mmetsp:Transcript_12991/g.43373  ORF Transcript_12991/g.43373 Transcript_12991/m.43373 type:complete len:276 (-) Transcript_12991:284-1111(-)